MTHPTIHLPFHRMPGYLDPRMTTTRNSTGTGTNRLGRVYTAPLNTLRQRWNPLSGVCEGVLVERQSENKILQSEDHTSASWTKTSLTATGNTTTAPDGSTTADTLTATGAGGNSAQAVTITVGRGLSVSIHAKPLATNWLYVAVTDGTNTVECWFNASTGATGTNTAGGATCAFSQKLIEAAGNGWFRCFLDVTTATNTSYTIRFGPAAADNTQPANTNSIYVWGAQAEAEVSPTSAATGYIPTTAATVTRSPDMLQLPIDSSWFNASEGSMHLEFVNRPAPATSSGSHVFGGVAAAFGDHFYLTRSGTTSLQLVWGSTAGGSGSLTRIAAGIFTSGNVVKMAFAWAANDVAFAVDGVLVGSSAAAYTPPTFLRLGFGCAPWTTSADIGNKPHAVTRRAAYYARRLPNATLIQLTAA